MFVFYKQTRKQKEKKSMSSRFVVCALMKAGRNIDMN